MKQLNQSYKNIFNSINIIGYAEQTLKKKGCLKEEFQGDQIIALSSKMYHCIGGKKKLSCKGINQKQNKLVEAHYRNALLGDSSQEFTNKGFKMKLNY